MKPVDCWVIKYRAKIAINRGEYPQVQNKFSTGVVHLRWDLDDILYAKVLSDVKV